MNDKANEILEDIIRFVRHEAMRAGVEQDYVKDVILYYIIDHIHNDIREETISMTCTLVNGVIKGCKTHYEKKLKNNG